MKYHIITYGCQRNKNDAERIAGVFENRGYKPASAINEADLLVINACSVRQSAVDRVWGQTKRFAKLKTQNSKIKTVLTGCVLPADKRKFVQRFDQVLDFKDLVKDFSIRPKYQTNFRAYVPIMTGCNNFCTFCAVPYTRGREVSRPAQEIICEVKNLVKRGYKEIWLLGENVNSYSKIPFAELLRKVNAIPGSFWIRWTSPHPKDFSDDLINALAECEKVTEYVNLPAQSGDDEILKKMNRPYTVSYYKKLVKKIRKKIPGVCLSTDVILGFPGETEKHFQNTVKLFKEIKFDMAYVAQYSVRPGTLAAKMENSVSPREKERRYKVLTGILRQTALENNKKYIGETVEALPEEEKKGFLIGKTKNYKTIKFEGPKDLIGRFVKLKVIGALPWGLKGVLII